MYAAIDNIYDIIVRGRDYSVDPTLSALFDRRSPIVSH